jgi:hypothetical protein
MRVLLLLLTAAFLLLAAPVAAQEEVASVWLMGVDSADFPAVTLSFTPRNATGNGLNPAPAITLAENGLPIGQFDLRTVQNPTHVTFVIDANRAIGWIDLIGDISRLAKVRNAIADYATRTLTGAGADRVSIVVMDGPESARVLVEGATSADEVLAAINSYDPRDLPAAAPVQAMLALALRQAAENRDPTLYHAIVLFSDTERLRSQVDFFALRAIQQQGQSVFFGAILGKFASADELAAIRELSVPGGGYPLAMPETASLAPIVATIRSNAQRTELRYRSRVTESGTQTVTLQSGDITTTAQFEVTVLPPELRLAADNRPIRRTGSPDQPFDLWEPTRQLLTAQIIWPDNHPRELEAVRFFVDDREQPLPAPAVLDPTGRLTWEWVLADLLPGEYALRVAVVDELGLSAESPPVTATIEQVIPPTPLPAATPTPLPPDPVPAPPPVAEGLPFALPAWLNERTVTLVLGGLIPLLALIALRKWQRRRATGSAAAPSPAPRSTALRAPAHFFLERLLPETGEKDESADPIPLTSAAVTIGSDPFRAAIVFDHDTVSRLHASLRFENGRFVLYDEGSTWGTLVNYQRLGLTPRPVLDGEEIHFGQVKVRLRFLPPDHPDRTGLPESTPNTPSADDHA